MSAFIFLVVIVIIGAIAVRYYHQRVENQLRENFPQRRVIEVSLPRGVNDSHKRMQKFYRKAVSAASGDPKERKQGLKQMDIVYLAECPEGQTMPVIRFLIYVDEDKMDAVKRSLKQVFDGLADVMELAPNHDPMAEIAAQLKPPPPPPSEELTDEEKQVIDQLKAEGVAANG